MISWKPLTDADALTQLVEACAAADDQPYPIRFSLSPHSIGGFNEADRLIAFGQVELLNDLPNEVWAYLRGRVHPAYRGHGLGTHLMTWLENTARAILQTYHDQRTKLMRIDYFDRGGDDLALFERHGFELAFAEDVLARNLADPIPECPLPDGMRFEGWHLNRAASFYEVYLKAFEERFPPDFTPTLEGWVKTYAGFEGFRVDWSLLVWANTLPVAYAMCGADQDAGYIAQMGVIPTHRRQGIAHALLAEVMRLFKAEVFTRALLDVNVDNAAARATYEQIGFRVINRYLSFQKQLAIHQE